jgi:hypothetical protein
MIHTETFIGWHYILIDLEENCITAQHKGAQKMTASL